MSPKSIIIFILIGILIYIFMNDKIELCYIEKFNNQVNLDTIEYNDLINLLNQEINTIVGDLTNKYKLNFNQEELRSLKKDIDILIKKTNKSSPQEIEENVRALLYKS